MKRLGKHISHTMESRSHRWFRSALMSGACALLLLGASPVAGETLQQAVELAVTSHPQVKRAEAKAKATEESVDEARAGYFPTVDFSGASGYEETNNPATRSRTGKDGDNWVTAWYNEASLTITQILFDGFSTASATEAAKLEAEADKLEVQQAEEDIALRAAEAYLDVLRTRELLALAQNNVNSHRRFRDQTAMRARTGVGPRLDIEQAEARLTMAESVLHQTRGALRSAEARYREAVGQMPGTLSVPQTPTSSVPSDPERGVLLAHQNSPALAAAQERVRARQSAIRGKNSAYYPQIYLEGTGSIDDNTNGVKDYSNSTSGSHSKQANLLLRFDYNLFNGGADEAAIRRSRAEATEAVEREGTIKRLIEQRVRLAYAILDTARNRVPVLETNVGASERVVDGYRRQFELGKRTLIDVLDAENELYQSRVNLLNAQYAFAFANYQTLAYMGNLVGTLRSTPMPSVPLRTVAATPAPLPPSTTSGSFGPDFRGSGMGAGASPYGGAGYRGPNVAPGYRQTPSGARVPSSPSPAPAPAPASTSRSGPYSVQVGAYAQSANADRRAAQLRSRGHDVRIISRQSRGRTLKVLLLGGYGSRAAAESAAASFRSKEGADAIVVRN